MAIGRALAPLRDEGTLGTWVRVRGQPSVAPDTIGNQEIGRLYLL